VAGLRVRSRVRSVPRREPRGSGPAR
jgi:hypothetical protein